ncbi:OmpA family protein [Pseudoduganella sp. R-31]|uniref:OmpA family protein n=1 Tax=Pseudoduganella sp. R-31 TaxID=3404060 RepID=UPI003CEE08AE
MKLLSSPLARHFAATAFCLSSFAIAAPASAGPDWAIDVAGGEDHPLIQRYNNSWMMAYKKIGFDQTTFPGKMGLDSHNAFQAPVTVEGQITRMVYFAPLGKSPLEVHRNYEQALKAAGFKAIVSCTPRDKGCDSMRYGFDDHYGAMKEADFRANRSRHPEKSALYNQMYSLGGSNMLGTDDIYFTYGTLSKDGNLVHVMVNSGKVYRTDFTTTYIEIAEPQAMQGGQVTVNADALKTALQSSGKIALYGIYFDTGKAEIKAAESRTQLDEMAKLLKSQPALKVYIVGHTDNQGNLDTNQLLSQQRAQAVVAALAKQYQIPSTRLASKGVASLAPVASNGDETGRARNRRVELVVQ